MKRTEPLKQIPSHSSFLTHHKGSTMKARIYPFIRRSAALLLALASFHRAPMHSRNPHLVKRTRRAWQTPFVAFVVALVALVATAGPSLATLNSLQGPCVVVIEAEMDGETATKIIHQWAFPDGLAEHFGGPPSMLDRFTDVVVHGEFDKLEDPMTWVLLAQFANDPKGTVKGIGFEVLMDELGFELDPEQMVLDEAGKLIGFDLNEYRYTQEDLLQALLEASRLVDTSGWSKTDWNDRITYVGMDGGADECGGAYVELWQHANYQGEKIVRLWGDPANLADIGKDGWVSSYRIGWSDPPVSVTDPRLRLTDVESGQYILQAYDGRPVTVQGDGSLIAGGAGTRFGVYNRGDGEYAIQGNSTWLNDDADGLRSSAPNGDYAEQHFHLVEVREGVLGIQTKAGKWLFTDENIGGQLSTNPAQIPHWWTFQLVGPLADVGSGRYTLEAYNGQSVTVQSDGSLVAGDGSGTPFGVYNRGNGVYAIQGGSAWLNADDYLSASAPNGDYPEQHFMLVDQGDGTVGIKTMAGKWLFTDENYGGQLSSNSDQIYHWWPFTLVGPLADVASGHYTLQAYDGRAVTVESDGKLFAGGGSGTDFYVGNRNNGTYAIQGNSTWLNADDYLRSSAPNGDYAEQHFKLVDQGHGTVAIVTSAGKWLFADDNYGGLLSTNSNQINNWWTFTLVPRLSGPSSPTAAMIWSGQSAFFMLGEEYLSFDIDTDRVSPGYPADIAARWSGWPADFVPTAAVNWDDDSAYIFSEDMRYLRYDIATDQVAAGYPADIVGRWSGWPADFVPTAAVNWGNGVAYFFSEDMRYLRFDIDADQVSGGYPRDIVGQWSGWPADFVPTAAVNWGNGVAYFFSEDQYLRFDIAADQVNSGYPLPIEGKWEGWPIIE